MPDPLAEVIGLAVAYARSAERLAATIATFQPVVASLQNVLELDPDLKPEMEAALEHVVEAVSACERAFKFSTAKLEASADRLEPQQEGAPE